MLYFCNSDKYLNLMDVFDFVMDAGEAIDLLDRMSERLGTSEEEIGRMSDSAFRAVFGFYQFRNPTDRQLDVLNDVRKDVFG